LKGRGVEKWRAPRFVHRRPPPGGHSVAIPRWAAAPTIGRFFGAGSELGCWEAGHRRIAMVSSSRTYRLTLCKRLHRSQEGCISSHCTSEGALGASAPSSCDWLSASLRSCTHYRHSAQPTRDRKAVRCGIAELPGVGHSPSSDMVEDGMKQSTEPVMKRRELLIRAARPSAPCLNDPST
jgi:hypothetical protein